MTMAEPHDRLDALDELLSRLVEGAATDADRRRLAELLRDDDEAQRRYVSVMSVHGWMGWDRARAPQPAAPSNPVAGRIGRPFVGVAASLAAAMLIVATVWIVSSQSGDDEPVEPTPTGPVVAVIGAADGVTWNSEPMSPGDELRTQPVRLADGRVEFEYLNGSMLTLVGPAELEIRDPLHSRLTLGWVSARVGSGTDGFTVSTPSGVSVVDLGTEFGVGVDADGSARVVVYDGSVELIDADRNVIGRVLAGETTKIDRTGTLGKLVPLKPSEAVRAPVPPRVLTLGHWDRDGNTSGWKLRNVDSHEVADGRLAGVSGSGSPAARDAQVTLDGLKIRADRYGFIEVRYRGAGSQAQLFFGANGNIQPGMFVTLPPSGGAWRTALIDLRDDERWTGVVGTLRIDPVSNLDAGAFAIDHIRLHAGDPTDGSLDPAHNDEHGARVYRLDPPAAPGSKNEEDGPVSDPLQES